MKTDCLTSFASFSAILLSLFEMTLQLLQTRTPAIRHGREPPLRLSQTLGTERVADIAPGARTFDELRLVEYLEMLRDRLPRDRQAARQLRGRCRPHGEPVDELAAGRVAERGEEVLLHVQLYGCTSARARQVAV